MSLLTWVLVGVLAYWLVATQLERQGVLPDWISVSGPLTTMHTQRGKVLLDRLAQRKRFWRAWANLGVGVALVVMVMAFLTFLLSALAAIQDPQTTVITEPRNVLVIPGVNDFLPLSVAPEIVLALLVGLVVHEGGHGLLCRVEDIEIDSMGLAFLTVVPMGAFVEPDEESQERADRGGKTRMFAAGVTNNFAITILAFALLFGPVAGSIGVASGVAVGGAPEGTPAEAAGIGGGDRITAVEGTPVDDAESFQAAVDDVDGASVTMEVDGEREVVVERSVLVAGAAAGTGIEPGTGILEVDGEPVRTVAELRSALAAADERATLTLDDGDRTERTLAIGARVGVVPDGPLADAGAEPRTTLVVTVFDGERILDHEELNDALDDREPGDEVTVAAYAGADRQEFEVTIGDDADPLGTNAARGINGLTLIEFGLQFYPAEQYFAILGGDVGPEYQSPQTDSFVGKVTGATILPFASLLPGGQDFNFAGFTGDVVNFYEVQGPLAPLGGLVFVFANVLFWTAWLNFNLGLFNCIPAFPLDGGHILRACTEAVVSRLPVEGSYALTKVVTISIGLLMGLSLVVISFGPRYFL